MVRTKWMFLGLLGCWACIAPVIVAGESENPSGQVAKPVSEDAKMLLRKVSLNLEETPLHAVAEFMRMLSNIPVVVSQDGGAKSVTLKLDDVTLAEAMRRIKDQCGCTHRVVDGKLLIATPEEFAAIDAGKSKFTPYKAPKAEK